MMARTIRPLKLWKDGTAAWAGPLTVRTADGRVERRQALTKAQVRAVVRGDA